MKTNPRSHRASWLLILSLCTGSTGLLRAEDEIEKAFRDALYAEEVKGDSEAALKAYREVGEKFEKQRDLAATALFRQGECLRKLGRKDEAAAIYNKVLALYGDRERVAKLSRENLTALGLPAPAASSPAPAAPAPPPDEEAQEIARLQSLADNSPDLLTQYELGNAAAEGRVKVVNFLLEKIPNLTPAGMAPALFAACSAGQLKICERLLDAGADPNGIGENSPLWTAIDENRIAVLNLLLARKANVNARRATFDAESTRPFVDALNEVRTAGEDPLHGMTLRNVTPVMAACWGNYVSGQAMRNPGTDLFGLLVKAGADLNAVAEGVELSGDSVATNKRFPVTALGMVVAQHNVEKVRALLAAKVDPKQPVGNPACSPFLLSLLAMEPKEPAESQDVIPQLLLDAGAEWKATLPSGASALHLCARRGLTSWLEKGIKAGLDVNGADKSGHTPLHMAAKSSSVECVRLLLAAGAKPDPASSEKSPPSPLWYACQDGRNIEILTLLLDAGANPNPVTPNFASPLESLCRGWMSGGGWPEGVKLLVERGARPGDVFQKSESWDRNKGAFSAAWKESFRAVWRAGHWRDNPRLSHAVWISQGESLPVAGRVPLFAAVLTDETAASRPPTLREFFSLAPDFVSRHASDNLSSGLQSDWEGVSVIRVQDGKEERIPVNMAELADRTEGQDMALLWGDVVELPVKSKTGREEDKQAERVNQWIYAPMPVEVRVEAGPGRFVTNSSQDSGMSFHANARDRANIRPGRPVPVVKPPEILRNAGVTNLLFSRSEVIRTSQAGELEPAEGGLHHGDIFRVKGSVPEAKITEENQYSTAWVCQSPEGPFWRVPVPKSISGKPVPLAGLMVALLGPHPLPSACFDWDKATVRYFAQKKEKGENSKKTEAASAGGWTEKKLLEAWPSLTLEQGMTITLPPAERDSFEPPAKLRTALTSALAFDWTLAVGDQPEVECRYEPRFFRGEKREGAWIWRDLDPKKATGPVLPAVEDLVAGNPRSGYPVRNKTFSVSWPDEARKTDRIEAGMTEASPRWALHDGIRVTVVVNSP